MLLFIVSNWFLLVVSGQEKTIIIDNPLNRTLTLINLKDSLELSGKKKTLIIFYALPNGNSIEWTMGKPLQPGDDWHYDIQHIAAQTRYLRAAMNDRNIIVVYMATKLKNWPAWKKQQGNGPSEIKRMVDSITGIFAPYHPEIMLNSHSGGGSFIFGYLDAVSKIPGFVQRIAFIDSDYGYEETIHSRKLIQWQTIGQPHRWNLVQKSADAAETK